jgi:ArsR family transcriptional regulator
MKELTTMFKALSDETRLRILKLLEDGECCVCDIVAGLGMTQPKISFHLATLKDAGLIRDRKHGRWSHYRLNDSNLFLRFLLLNTLEKIPPEAVAEDRKRLVAFLGTRERRAEASRSGCGCAR